jgi:hypothetical protein
MGTLLQLLAAFPVNGWVLILPSLKACCVVIQCQNLNASYVRLLSEVSYTLCLFVTCTEHVLSVTIILLRSKANDCLVIVVPE